MYLKKLLLSLPGLMENHWLSLSILSVKVPDVAFCHMWYSSLLLPSLLPLPTLLFSFLAFPSLLHILHMCSEYLNISISKISVNPHDTSYANSQCPYTTLGLPWTSSCDIAVADFMMLSPPAPLLYLVHYYFPAYVFIYSIGCIIWKFLNKSNNCF